MIDFTRVQNCRAQKYQNFPLLKNHEMLSCVCPIAYTVETQLTFWNVIKV